MMSLFLSFKGRTSRKLFWVGMVVLNLIIVGMAVIDFTVIKQELPMLTMAASFLAIWPFLAIQVKRWHDRDKVGWWVLIGVIPAIGPIWALVETGFLSGTEGDNRFGEQPR